MRLFVYDAGIIDDWYGWRSFSETHPIAGVGSAPDELRRRLELTGAAAREMGWEGNVREGAGPYWAPIPLPDEPGASDFIIAWKQDNSGSTFVASPYRLPWFAGCACREVASREPGVSGR
jgi:hypothetical protein